MLSVVVEQPNQMAVRERPQPQPSAADVPETSSAIIEPFAVAAQVTTRTGVFDSDIALIYGAGPVGLNILQVLTGVHGIRALITDQIDERLDLARMCGAGADDVINTKREALPEALAKRGVDGGPTLIYDAVGHPSILEEAVRIAAPAGRIGVLGFSTHPSAIPQQELTKKELTLYASRLNCSMFPRVIEWVAKGLVHPERIIRSEEHTSELQSRQYLVCRLLLERSGARRLLPAFPTRRSSDLAHRGAGRPHRRAWLLHASVRDPAAGAHEERTDPLRVAAQLLNVSAGDRMGGERARASGADHQIGRAHV